MGKRSLRKGNTDFLNGLGEQTFCIIESKILTTKCVVIFQVHAEFASFDTSSSDSQTRLGLQLSSIYCKIGFLRILHLLSY